MSSSLLTAGDIVRIRGDRWRVARQVSYEGSSVVEALGCDRSNRAERASFVLPAEIVERLPASDRPRVVSAARWRRTARALLGAATPAPTSLMTAARAAFEILPFQLEPVLAITSGAGCRVLIADEVGLGKTIQAALVVAELLERTPGGRALIVTPAGLREQWQRELERLFHLAPKVVDSGSLPEMSSAASGANPWAAHPVLVTSIDFIKRAEVLRSLEPLIWDVVVFDEAHALAGHSDRAAVATALGIRARHVVLLTATPHGGDEPAFERLCSIGDIDADFPLMLFRRTRADAGLPVARRTSWLRVRPSPAERSMYRTLAEYTRAVWRSSLLPAPRLVMTLLARRAASSAASLAISAQRRLDLLSGCAAPATQVSLPLFDTMSDEVPDALLAVSGLPDPVREREWLLRLLVLARAASLAESKVHALQRLLRRARTPVLVFTEYRDTLERISAQLDRKVVQLHGGLSAAERADAAARFTSADAAVMLATDAASEGLNLQRRCHVVVNLELPWSPVRLEQRIGRVDRIGQRCRVHAVNFVARGTIEERVVERLTRRTADARAALSAPSSLSCPDFRRAARDEAERLLTARALLRGNDLAPISGRPIAARVPRRRPLADYCWVVRVRFGTAREDLSWEALLGMHATVPRLELRAAADLLSALRIDDLVEEAIAAAVATVERHARTSLDGLAALATRRERAIARLITEQRARMAAALVQPTLFDRRIDRAAAAQQAVADDALRRCAERLRRLDALRSVSVHHRELAFAVVVG